MANEIPEARFLDDAGLLTLADLCDATGLGADELRELLEEAAPPMAPQAGPAFGSQVVVVAQAAVRIRREFALDDAHSVVVVLRLVERVRALEREIRSLRTRVRD
jgi:hypothetical protein